MTDFDETIELDTEVNKRKKRCFDVKAVILQTAKHLALMLVGAVIALLIVPNSLAFYIGSDNLYSKLTAIDKIVKDNYVDADKVDEQILADMTATGYVLGLGDKYAAYIDKDAYLEALYSGEGGSYGIGVSLVLNRDGNGIYVVNVSAASPADIAGIKSGDIITAVDGATVNSENYADSVDKIRGELGTKVALTVMRADGEKTVEVTRGEYTVTSVFHRMIDTYGYISITSFNAATVEQFNEALDEVTAKGATGLIIDLRDNPGGSVDAATAMLDVILPEGEICYAVYTDGERHSYMSSDKDSIDLPIAVLTNSSSASAAELFASALKDSANAVVIGETTYGKGIMQGTFPLSDGSAVKITIAKFYTKSGAQLHGKGLKPDVEVSFTEKQAANRYFLTDGEEPFIKAAVEKLSEK